MIIISDIKNQYGNAMALAIICCRVYFKTAMATDLNAFICNNNIDWIVFFKTCRKHRIRPLVYKIILKATLPEEIQKRISNELNKISLQSFDQARETERLILLLQQNNINVIPYKGTAFSKQFFGTISMRESSDIDLVIDSNDITKAIHTLENDGFQSHQKNYYYSLGHKQFIKRHKDFNFDKYTGNSRQYHVELHFNIISKNIYVSKYQNDFKTSSLGKDSLFKEQVSILNPIEHFRAISLHHMLQDGMGYLKTVVDVSQGLIKMEMIENSALSNSFEKETLKEMNTNYDLQIIQLLIRDLMGIEFKIENVKNNSNKTLTTKILSSSYKKNITFELPFLEILKFYYNYSTETMKYYKKTKHKSLFLIKNLLTVLTPQSNDFMAVNLNKNLYFFYYFIRPFRLIFFRNNPK
ncbi:nucleotidyltransferase family protein [Flavobacterium sp. WC2429]|uniref:Nucleotidyltransferase family protein n=2 Tax=unclassified Flavobacterium TaxID=196869 RepID=A0AB39WBA7_9FLAO